MNLSNFIHAAQAQSVSSGLQATAESAFGPGTTATTIPVLVSNLVNASLGLIGVLFLVLMVFSGYQWMTSGGDPEKVIKAKTRIQNAVIGMVLVTAAFAISRFILGALIGATTK